MGERHAPTPKILIEDGKPLTVFYRTAHGMKGASFLFTCCDCGLVHDVVIIPLRTRLKMYLWRDNKRTANRRREKECRETIKQLMGGVT